MFFFRLILICFTVKRDPLTVLGFQPVVKVTVPSFSPRPSHVLPSEDSIHNCHWKSYCCVDGLEVKVDITSFSLT